MGAPVKPRFGVYQLPGSANPSTHAMASGSAPSAACCPKAECKRSVGRQPAGKWNAERAKSCWWLMAVTLRPGSAAHAITFESPAARKRLLRARRKRHIPALLSWYWPKALNVAGPVLLRSPSFLRIEARGVNRMALVWKTTRAAADACRRGNNSQHNNACESKFTWTIASMLSSVSSRGSPAAPPRPALQQKTSSAARRERKCAANPRTDAKEAKSKPTSGTTTAAAGTASTIARAAAAASFSKPGRTAMITSKPRRANSCAA
mmetsp:Transcript_28615/g.86469  ORF Transcript_28615/g.86469 Transcript_28615/m.86469 type:complete len:264 (+) Transcript_28615:338-1129(+)